MVLGAVELHVCLVEGDTNAGEAESCSVNLKVLLSLIQLFKTSGWTCGKVRRGYLRLS